MPAAFKWGRQENIYAGLGFLFAHKAGRQGHYIGVVMLAGQGSYFGIPAKGRAYTMVAVGGHIHAITASANEYSKVNFLIFNGLSYRVCKIRVIGTVG